MEAGILSLNVQKILEIELGVQATKEEGAHLLRSHKFLLAVVDLPKNVVTDAANPGLASGGKENYTVTVSRRKSKNPGHSLVARSGHSVLEIKDASGKTVHYLSFIPSGGANENFDLNAFRDEVSKVEIPVQMTADEFSEFRKWSVDNRYIYSREPILGKDLSDAFLARTNISTVNMRAIMEGQFANVKNEREFSKKMIELVYQGQDPVKGIDEDYFKQMYMHYDVEAKRPNPYSVFSHNCSDAVLLSLERLETQKILPPGSISKHKPKVLTTPEKVIKISEGVQTKMIAQADPAVRVRKKGWLAAVFGIFTLADSNPMLACLETFDQSKLDDVLSSMNNSVISRDIYGKLSEAVMTP